MKTVTPDPLGMERAGNRIAVRDLRMVAMEGGIEACNLQKCWRLAHQRANRRQVVRLVKRRQRDELLELLEGRRIDDRRCMKLRAAMNDAMTHGDREVA